MTGSTALLVVKSVLLQLTDFAVDQEAPIVAQVKEKGRTSGEQEDPCVTPYPREKTVG